MNHLHPTMPPYKVKIDPYNINIEFSPNIEKLQYDWESIQSKAPQPCFLTWGWINNWIRTYNPEYIVISALFQNEVVAIGLFTLSVKSAHLGISSNQLRLHQTGNDEMDQIWMEYNDFITVGAHRSEAVNACIQVLGATVKQWDEIVVSMTKETRGTDITKYAGSSYIQLTQPCYATDLATIREKNISYLESLRPNTRYQIRRSIKLYEQAHGPMTIEIASNREQALQFFHDLGPLHKKRWSDSGFKNEKFLSFHENLIRGKHRDLDVELVKVKSGSTTISIIYNIIAGRTVYFYMQGVLYEADKKLKPGLVSHSLLIQRYLNQEMDVYDFMGGYSQYKAQLAEPSGNLVTIVIKRSNLMFRLEKFARKTKKLLNKYIA